MEDYKLLDFLSHVRIECRVANVSQLSLAATDPEINYKEKGFIWVHSFSDFSPCLLDPIPWFGGKAAHYGESMQDS